jgi:predicted metal-dependent enzyme (double-stranded beta helix superfamily)
MFDKERFIESCRGALKEPDPRGAIESLVARAVNAPGEIMRSLGEPTRAGVNVLWKAEDLTILNLCWGPGLRFHPHDHRMWAVIGIYAGQEQNFFYQRSGQGLERHGMRELNAGETARLGRDVIHAVTNPLNQITAAIHVYGGDFFATPRSEWDPQTFEERPYDTAATMRIFEESNARLGAAVSR